MIDKERRSAQRVGATKRGLGKVTLDLDTQILKLSPRGMAFEVTMPVEIGSTLHFVIVLDDEELTVDGVVRNCVAEPALGTPTYTVGVEFAELDDSIHSKFRRFVESKNKE